MYIEMTDAAVSKRRRGNVSRLYETRVDEDDVGDEIALEISPPAVILRGNCELIQGAFKSHQRANQPASHPASESASRPLLARFPELSNYLPRYDNQGANRPFIERVSSRLVSLVGPSVRIIECHRRILTSLIRRVRARLVLIVVRSEACAISWYKNQAKRS